MDRDFTESLQQEMLAMVDTFETWLYLQDTPEEFEAYEDYREHCDLFPDYEYAMNHIETHRQWIIQDMYYDAEKINGIFSDVREYDSTYPETISSNASTFFDAYIETLNGLVDAITVKDSNSPYNTTEMYAMSAREQYGKWGSMSSNYGGLLNNCGYFAQQIRDAGGGIIQECYESIRDVDGEGFQALMDKSIEEIKPWEVVALSLVFEDCIGEDGNIDCEKLEELLNSCYRISSECQFTGPMSGNRYEVDIELAPVVTLLDRYMTNSSNQLATAYENSDLRNYYDINIKDVQAKCYLSDVIYCINTYYPEHHNSYFEMYVGNGNSSRPINLEMNEDGTIANLDFYNTEDKVTIYRFTDDYMQELYAANLDMAASGLVDPEQQLFLDSTMFVVDEVFGATVDELANYMPVVGTINTIYGLASDMYGLYESYNENVENNESIYHHMNNQELLSVMYATDCSASIIQCGDRCDIRNVAFDTTDVICQTALYNQAVQGDYPYEGQTIDSYQTVQEEFNQYMSGQKPLSECPSLQALIDFDRGNAVYEDGTYSDYLADVETELESHMGEDNVHPGDVNTEELLQVVDSAAVIWLDDEKEDLEDE